MTPEQIRVELAALNTQTANLRTEAAAAQTRAHKPWMADRPPQKLWAECEAAIEAWLSSMDLVARCEGALLEALLERDRLAHGLAVEKYENGEDVA